ncbi:1-aminocyclopropane-1-carboxylate deaminase/D-cysteine desulfhydrase [Anaerostipes caccae]|uniref:1-aminocyclopropane-1-carboxylate deaminase/D-cysteine desulfhydrase n=1 Tax=Anaerostipes caccae TaxID=105841 RepID=UPI0038D49A3D
MKELYSPIYKLVSSFQNNNIYIKREDQIPLSFGGNKARKASLFFQDIKKKEADCIVTYGSGSSNHCRIVSNMAAANKIKCVIISPEEEYENTFNSTMMELFGAKICMCSVLNVKETINKVLEELKSRGMNPYFIQGGGHGNLGTQAYVNAYDEIVEWEIKNKIKFDYIFHASGTGTTQAGLICGQLQRMDYWRKIIGISIARKEIRGKQIIAESIESYMGNQQNIDLQKYILFDDQFTGDGYGKTTENINDLIEELLINETIPLDSTYTGKAFYGMRERVQKDGIQGKNILFIHTGGTPLFYDWLCRKRVKKCILNI